jgi:hypothetical protein
MTFNHQNINYSNFIYYKPIYIDSLDVYMSKIKYKSNDRKKSFVTQTSLVTVKQIIKHEDKYELIININNDKFYKFMNNIDNLNLSAITHSTSWFPKSIKANIINLYEKPIRRSIKRVGVMSIFIPITKGSIECDIYNKEGVSITMGKLQVDTEIIITMELRGIIYEQNSFYPEWKTLKITVCDETFECLFRDNNDRDIENIIYSPEMVETDSKIIIGNKI